MSDPLKPRLGILLPQFPDPADTWFQAELGMLIRLGWEINVFALDYGNRQIAALPPEIRALAAGAGERTRPSVRRASLDLPSDPAERLVGDPERMRKTVQSLARGQPIKMLEMRAFSNKAIDLAREMRGRQIGHLHVQYATRPALAAWIVHNLTGIPYSVRVHGPELAIPDGVTPEALQGAAFLAAATQDTRDRLGKQYGPGVAERTTVVHYGLNIHSYTPRVGILRPEPPFEVICSRPLEPGQGLESLVDACAELLKEGLPLHLQIIGEGGLRRTLKNQIDQRKLNGAVDLPGALNADQRARRMAAADCYIDPLPDLTGQREALPLAMFEALACALPVVATNLPGRNELIRHYETGVLIPPGDRSTLASGIRDVYNSPAKAARLARAGREWIAREFDPLVNARLLGSLILGQR
ncbi:glycosyltransferase [Longilinea arvoryzae]|uniref:Glycosyltransferase n=1 Tax=Longilinea arvoryzae TaxID=360412 RepID=A0A0S7BET1_9CHLR|nr:glycosyltransferase family 4 protein [Longilinea arvoryzae]GAP13428.1 glycosyltransferase [Longilinea arvoryzae]